MTEHNPVKKATGVREENDPPESMKELLGRAENHWKLNDKNKAFMEIIAAIGMMSDGVAQAMHTSDQALKVAKVALDNIDKDKE